MFCTCLLPYVLLYWKGSVRQTIQPRDKIITKKLFIGMLFIPDLAICFARLDISDLLGFLISISLKEQNTCKIYINKL